MLTYKVQIQGFLQLLQKKTQLLLHLSVQVSKWTFVHNDTLKTSWTFYKLKIFVHIKPYNITRTIIGCQVLWQSIVIALTFHHITVTLTILKNCMRWQPTPNLKNIVDIPTQFPKHMFQASCALQHLAYKSTRLTKIWNSQPC
jgi:hypothetical protein